MEYEGTRYRGFQWQPNGPTIQDELEKALLKLTGQKTPVAGASRTDSGVHARGQVVSFSTKSVLPSETFVTALNHYLPRDIAVTKAWEVLDSFDVRHNACNRRYRYSILNRREPSPLLSTFTHQVREVLDVAAMNAASKSLIGTHDFASFCGHLGTEEASTVREVFDVGVTRDGDLVSIDIEANAFLPQQVRRTAGILVEVGLGKKTGEEIQQLLEHRRPGVVGPTLPAKGLCLEEVSYKKSNIVDVKDNEDL